MAPIPLSLGTVPAKRLHMNLHQLQHLHQKMCDT